MSYQTTAAYLSGAICGHMWMGPMAGLPLNVDLRREFGRMDQGGWRDVLTLILSENGGDFQDAEFTADTVIRIERRSVQAPGVYTVHVRERELAEVASLADLVNSEHYAGDFMGEYD